MTWNDLPILILLWVAGFALSYYLSGRQRRFKCPSCRRGFTTYLGLANHYSLQHEKEDLEQVRERMGAT
jgi:hypothetical protein